MSPESQEAASPSSPYIRLLYRTMFFLAVLIVARFILEVAGAPHQITRFVSSSLGLFLAAIYVAAVAPLRGGMTKLHQLPLPAFVLSAWTQLWVILATVVTGVFRLERSHFLEPEEFGSWARLGGHLVRHLIEIVAFAVVAFVLMLIVFTLRRWPVTVAPGAMLGAIVVLRYFTEALGLPPANTAAWSSTVGVLIAGFYLGGMASRVGLTTSRQLLAPALVLGWTWRVWVFVATLLSALLPFYRTHFFDPTGGRVAARLIRFFFGGVLVEGLIAGLIVWGIAVWIARSTRPATA